MRRSVIKKCGIVHLELTYLECHIVYRFVKIVVQNTQVAFHRLDWAWEIEIKSEVFQNVLLEVDKHFFVQRTFFLIVQKVNHTGETRAYWLLEFCRHQYADGG